MSTTSPKRPRDDALRDARDLCRLFDRSSYERWEPAGSLRRKRPEVGDVEHVVIPTFGDVADDAGLFAAITRANLLFHRLDQLVSDGTVLKHIYGATGFRWGAKYRGVEFRGQLHEFYCCDADNFGSTLAIRTGPAEFSQRLVTGLIRQGLRQRGGRVVREMATPGGVESAGAVIPAPDERAYFGLCGIAWAEPEDR